MKKQTYSVEIFKPKIGIKLIREEPQNYQILTIDEGQKSNPEIQQWVKNNFTQLCIRIRKAKNHVMKLQFIPSATPIQQKGHRTAIHLQERAEIELNELIDKKTQYENVQMLGQTVHQPDCNHRQEKANSKIFF